GSEVRKHRAAAELREERVSEHPARVPRAPRKLHASRLHAVPALRGGTGRPRPELAGRVLLSMPRLEVRSRGPRFHRRPGPRESRGAALPLHQRQHHIDRAGYREHLMASTEADVFDRLGRRLNALGAWIDKRFPMTKLIKEHATEYYASKNFNIWYA